MVVAISAIARRRIAPANPDELTTMTKPTLGIPAAITRLATASGLLTDHQARHRDAERDHAAAVEALDKAEASLARSVAAYDASLSEGREAALAARRAQADAEVDRDVARHNVERLAAHVRSTQEAAARAETERLSDAARESAAEFEAAARRDLKSMGATARRLVRLWVEAHLAREAAVRAGADESGLPNVEGFRAVQPRPRQVLETKRITRWINPWTGDALDDQLAAQVRNAGGGVAFLDQGGSEPTRLTERAEFDRIVYLEPEVGPRLVSLVQSLSVPGLMADDTAGWSGPGGTGSLNVSAHLAMLEGAPAPDRRDQRERKIELRRVMPNGGAVTAD